MIKNIKKILKLAICLFVSLLFAACNDVPWVDIYQPVDVKPLNSFASSFSQNSEEQHRVFKDTITPPSNPMYEVPYIPGTYTFRGVLQLERFKGSLYCVVRTMNNDYFLMDDGIMYLFRLDNPQLKDCAVGDTIMVNARPMKLIPEASETEYSLATYYVYPQIVSSSNNK